MSDTDSTTSESLELTQANYKATPYQDQSWEVIGDPPSEASFMPMQIEVLAHDQLKIDPMFADYGGISTKGEQTVWHLPEGVAGSAHSGGKNAEALKEEKDRKSYTDDELQALIKEAEERGRQTARAEAEENQKAKFTAIEENTRNILIDMQKQIQETLLSAEKEALELSIAIAEKIMNYAVEVNPEYINQIINEAMSHTGSANINKIKISPQDFEFIELIGLDKNLQSQESKWNFESDPQVRAGCIVETSSGEVDFQLDHAFERIKDNILKAVK